MTDQPRTTAGRVLLDREHRIEPTSDYGIERRRLLLRAILAIEAEAAASEAGLREALREVVDSLEACRIGADEAVTRAGSARAALGTAIPRLDDGLNRLAAAEDKARSLLSEKAS